MKMIKEGEKMKHNTMKQLFAVVLTIAALITGQSVWAASSFTVECTNNTFTVTRTTNTTTTETVCYRTVSLSALEGKNFTSATGNLVFDADHNTRSVTITETSINSIDAKYCFQNSTTRAYRFEVVDKAGLYLAHCDRTITYGDDYVVDDKYVNQSITDLVYFQNGRMYSGVPTTKYYDVVHAGTSNTDLKIDDGYDYNNNTLCTVSTSSFFNQLKAPQSYYNDLKYKLYATVHFEQKEKDDGYQYIQILTDNSTTYDGKDGDGKIDNGPSTSIYKAAFILTKTENVYSSGYKFQAFPHKSDDTYNNREFDYSDSYLYQQKFQSASYRAENSGSLVLSPTVNNINVRFDANGSGDDTWYVRNLKVRLALCDATSPTRNSFCVAPGRHSRGDRVYVSVAFSETVTISGSTKKLSSSWGDLTYVEGNKTNVLTFMGTIPDNATGALNITGLTGDIADLVWNAFDANDIKTDGICALDESYAFTINYDLAGGSVASANPGTYTWDSASFTLNNPTRTGYVFTGWTGSNGDTPQTEVTIANHSNGDRTYTANWVQVWSGSGTAGDPYIISSTQGLDALASYVNGGNNCSGVYFELGSNISYSPSAGWSALSNMEHNYYAIGTSDHPFSGSFNGKDYTISGIRIFKGSEGSNSSNQGIFGVVENGTVSNVKLSNSRITGRNNAGGIVGHSINSVVEGCTVGNNVAISTFTLDCNQHGGIVGLKEGGEVQRCISSVTLGLTSNSGGEKYGAIVGSNQSGIVSHCVATGATVPTVSSIGAIAGVNSGDLQNNYYYSCTVANTSNAVDVGCNGADVAIDNGAVSMHTISLPATVTIASRDAVEPLPGSDNAVFASGARISSTEYYAVNSSVSLNYVGDVANDCSVIYSATAGTIDNNVFTVPAANASISAGVFKNDYITHWQASPTHSGSASSTAYLITTPEGLLLLSSEVAAGNSFEDKYFKVDNDIDMSGVANFTPIGTDDVTHRFKGYFDGNNKTIRHLTVDRGESNFAGLFGSISLHEVKNIILDEARITGKRNIGGIVGYLASATISNCVVTRSILTSTNNSSSAMGAIIGNVIASNSKINQNKYHSTIVYVTNYSGSDFHNGGDSFNIGVGSTFSGSGGDISDACLDASQLMLPEDADFCTALLTAYNNPSAHTAYGGSAPNVGALTQVSLSATQANVFGESKYVTTFFNETVYHLLPEDARAYTASLSGSKIVFHLIGNDGRVIPSGTAAIIVSDSSTVTLAKVASQNVSVYAGNILQGSDTEIAAPAGTVYVLGISNNTLGFYKYTGSTIPAGKAYYVVNE